MTQDQFGVPFECHVSRVQPHALLSISQCVQGSRLSKNHFSLKVPWQRKFSLLWRKHLYSSGNDTCNMLKIAWEIFTGS